MGVSTITAARIYAGQQQGDPGEEYNLAFDHFDNVALVKTYNTDSQVPDSAGTITAIMSGQKTRIGVVGVDASVARDDCAAALKGSLPSIAELAEQGGLRTGVVSTARITHATLPAPMHIRQTAIGKTVQVFRNKPSLQAVRILPSNCSIPLMAMDQKLFWAVDAHNFYQIPWLIRNIRAKRVSVMMAPI